MAALYAPPAGAQQFGMRATTTGALQVHSVPSGARVLLEGQDHGTTPLVMEGLVVGEHALRLEARGYTVHHETVIIRPGETVSLRIVLDLALGRLGWSANRDDVEVVVGARRYRESPVELPVGVYRVRFRAAGFREIERIVTIEADRTTYEQLEFGPD